MKKKIVSLVMATLLAATAVAGCGSNGGSAASSAAGSTAASGAASSAAAGGTTIKIGSIGPSTGGAAAYGQAVMNGAQIAVDEINAAGGINGVKIEFKFQDDEHDAEK